MWAVHEIWLFGSIWNMDAEWFVAEYGIWMLSGLWATGAELFVEDG
jgi:hypothetical protein